ncbi:MAG: hypothetical protein U1F61_22985 [Opitutaceae bacterium]
MFIFNRRFRRGLGGFLLLSLATWLASCTSPGPGAAVPASPKAVPVQAQPTGPRGEHDAFVVLSGGGTPLSNNYSQYLQARALNDWLRGRYPADAIWTFFGAGNRPDAPPVFSDTRKQNKEGGMLVESWLPGPLTGNRAATREEILKALREEVLPRVAKGGTLFLFVGDHGELSRTEPRESVVTLWQMENRGSAGGNWRTNQSQVLGVNELRAALEAGLGQGRVVFCFTCCHSGGFHFLGQPRTVAPNPSWFDGFVPVEAADWSSEPTVARMAGFTATTEDSLAAGCAPDPDPDRWAGSERFIPEALLGQDLMSGARKGPGLASFAEAFDAAMVVNRTIDKPHSTAEAYLAAYATLIETQLASAEGLTPAVRARVARYAQVVDGTQPTATDAAFLDQKRVYARYLEALVEQNPLSESLLRTGTRAQLEAAIGPVAGNAQGRQRRGMNPEVRRQWTDVIRPVWKAAVQAGGVPGLGEAAREFELHLIAMEETSPRRELTPGNRDAVRNELFWKSGYAIPSQTDAKKAIEMARWEAARRSTILDWARGSESAAVREAAEKWGGPVRSGAPTGPGFSGTPRAARKEALQRALFFRRVLAAWDFLLALEETPALTRLASLRDLERRPLPRPGL